MEENSKQNSNLSIVERYLRWINTFAGKQLKNALGASVEKINELKEAYPDTPQSLISLLSHIDGTYYRKYPKGEITQLILASDVTSHYLGSVDELLQSRKNNDSIDDIYGGYSQEELENDYSEWDGTVAGLGVDPAAPFSKRLWFSDCYNNGGTAQLFVDFAPCSQGVYGQIIRYKHANDEYAVIAKNFDEYLEKVMGEWMDMVIYVYSDVYDTPIKEFTFRLTGNFSKPIHFFENYILSQEGKIADDFNFDFLIVGSDSDNDIINTAHKLGIPVLTENLFLELFNIKPEAIDPSKVEKPREEVEEDPVESGPQLETRDAEILLLIASSLEGKNSTWTPEENFSKWENIVITEIDSRQRVTGLFFTDGTKGVIPEQIGELDALESVTIDMNFKVRIPENISKLTRLKNLEINLDKVENLPDCFDCSPQLEQLFLYSENQEELPPFPPSLRTLQNLKKLYLQNVNLDRFPEFILENKNLEILDLCMNNLKEIPEQIGELNQLCMLILSDNKLEILPESMKDLDKLTTLKLDMNRLKSLPYLNKCAPNLNALLLYSNHLTALPDWFSRLNPESLRIDENDIIGEIPSYFGNMTNLKVLCLQSNYFTGGLPDSLKNLINLVSFYYFDNEFDDTPPKWINDLPCIQKNNEAPLRRLKEKALKRRQERGEA